MNKTSLALAAAAGVLSFQAPLAVAAVIHNHAVKTAEAVISATDHAPIMESQALPLINGTALYTSYSDRRAGRAATYLHGHLAQLTLNTNLYAATGNCFKHQQLPKFVGLTRLASSLLPLPTKAEPVTYDQSGRTLHWRKPATPEHSVESGTVTFNRADRIVKTTIAAYTYKTTTTNGSKKASTTFKTNATTMALSYPKTLPAGVPDHQPAPACKAS